MFKLKLMISLVALLVNHAKLGACFVPARIMGRVINSANLVVNLGKTSETVTHEDIVRRGLIHSAVKYFYDKSGLSNRVNLSKLETGEYYDLKNLYRDYYGVLLCKVMLEDVITNEIQPNVAIVDFDPATKDNPHAHFDAETFANSNERVIQHQTMINAFLAKKDYPTVRRLSGQILHTIQDFYSHSNWVEMGNTGINLNIGQPNMNGQTVVSKTDNITCIDSCELVTVNCSLIVQGVIEFIKGLGLKPTVINCPVKFYKCSDNIKVENNKLVSGYYSNQKLNDGTAYEKPTEYIKCSHGGILDASAAKNAHGGINKDSGFYLFSPHANYHLKAAELGIKHTAYFINQIRTQIGDAEFANFLQLDETRNLVNITNGVQQCAKNVSIKVSYDLCSFFLVIIVLNFMSLALN